MSSQQTVCVRAVFVLFTAQATRPTRTELPMVMLGNVSRQLRNATVRSQFFLFFYLYSVTSLNITK